ncbi:hypothetical protein BV20DRAFT_461126 [Pilatotrama ljubarskyi]|nr:hypothetical protein BV20DRAFT_461126 [Pilatotrama ljubarskyi]
MASSVPKHGCGSDGYIFRLSQAGFSRLEPGRAVLRLVDPTTHESCDYQLVKIPRRPSTSPDIDAACFSSGRAGAYARSPLRSGVSGLVADSVDGRQQIGSQVKPCRSVNPSRHPGSTTENYYPLARLPPLAVRSRGDGTPSLFNDSGVSEASTPSFTPTSPRQLFSRSMTRHINMRLEQSGVSCTSGSSVHMGLGFSGLLNSDGTPFNGLGSLPRRTSTPQRGCISPTSQAINHRRLNQELQAMAHLPAPHSDRRPTSVNDNFTTPATAKVASASPPRAPARRRTSVQPEATPPTRPEQDDVFLSRPIRVPGSLTQGLLRRALSAGGTKPGENRDRDILRVSGKGSPAGTLGRRVYSSWVKRESLKKREVIDRPSWRP